jgi:hypothetical protein
MSLYVGMFLGANQEENETHNLNTFLLRDDKCVLIDYVSPFKLGANPTTSEFTTTYNASVFYNRENNIYSKIDLRYWFCCNSQS